jgi:predicted RNase H-like HicB family nuclease
VRFDRDDEAGGIWVARIATVPGFILGAPTFEEAERKVREHLPAFLAA